MAKLNIYSGWVCGFGSYIIHDWDCCFALASYFGLQDLLVQLQVENEIWCGMP